MLPGAWENREPSYLERVFRAFSVRGPVSNLVTAPAQLGIQMADLTQPEFLWLGRTRRFACSQALGASVGNNPIAELQISAFGALGVAYVTGKNPTAAYVQMLIGFASSLTGGLLPSNRVQALDNRQDGGSVAGLSYVPAIGVAVAAGTGTFVQFNTAPNESFRSGPWVISTDMVGSGVGCLRAVANTTNIAFDLGFEWVERRAGDNEKA